MNRQEKDNKAKNKANDGHQTTPSDKASSRSSGSSSRSSSRPWHGLPAGLKNGVKIIHGYLKHLSYGPGVYRMIDQNGKVLYVGKAISLRKRVASYTRPLALPIRLQRMIAATTTMEFLLTANEVEALLLENNLIKHFSPPYNVLLRDDKTHLELLIRKDHDFPQIQRHRGAHKRKGNYYGPYASAQAVSSTLHLLERLFQLRNCSDNVFAHRKRPCLQYQIKRCSAPCVGYISQEAYQKSVDLAESFLRGKGKIVGKTLSVDMEKAAKDRDYERAAALRDRIRTLTQFQTQQDINGRIEGDGDVIALAKGADMRAIQIIYYRGGRHNGNQVHYAKLDDELTDGEFLTAFLGQLYQRTTPPKTILLSHAPDEAEILFPALESLRKGAINWSVPKRGDKKRLIDQAVQNAENSLLQKLNTDKETTQRLEELSELVGFQGKLNRIEVYDNSHLSGTNPVGAMIVAGPQGFEKTSYRTFNIKGQGQFKAENLTDNKLANEDINSADDYAMMREVIERRFIRALGEREKALLANETPPPWPDLVILDGGKGQLFVVMEVIKNLDFENAPIFIAVAKGEERNKGREKIFLAPDKPAIELPHDDALLYYIQRLRDEAHRFAIGTQRQRRKKRNFADPLADVPNIGAKRRKMLMLHFGSARAVAGAGLDDLKKTPGISESLAEAIYDHFHPN